MPFGELIEKIPILPVNKGFQQAKRKLDSIVYNMIKEHRDNEKKGTQQGDLLYTLLQAQDIEAGIGRMTDSDKIIRIEDATRRHVKSGLGEFSENQKLEEAQKETTTLSTSNTTLTAASSSLSSNISNKADLEAGKILNFEVSLPYRDMQRYITALRKKGKNEVWLTITINASTGKMISVKTGRNTELETNSIHDIHKSRLLRNKNCLNKSGDN